MFNKLNLLILFCFLGYIPSPAYSQLTSIPDSLYSEVVSLKKRPVSAERNNQILTLFFELIIHYHPTGKGNWRDSLFVYTKHFNSEYGRNLSGLARAEKLCLEGNLKEGTAVFLKSISNLEKTHNYAQAAFGLLRLGVANERMVQNSNEKDGYPIYYKKGLALANKSKQPAYQVLALGYIASFNQDKNNYNEMINIGNKMLKVVSEDKTHSALQYLGTAYKYLGFGYLGLEKEVQAKKYFHLARIWTRSPGRNLYLDYSIHQSLAQYYFQHKQFKKSLVESDSALISLIRWKADIVALADSDKYLGDIYELKYKNYKGIEKIDSTLFYLEKLFVQRNINIKNELDKNYQEFNEKYGTKEKEIQIVELNNKSLKQESKLRSIIDILNTKFLY